MANEPNNTFSRIGPAGVRAEWVLHLQSVRRRIDRTLGVLRSAKECIPTAEESARTPAGRIDARQSDLFVTFVSLEVALEECERWARQAVAQTRDAAEVERPCD
jgi:hypothetical protein